MHYGALVSVNFRLKCMQGGQLATHFRHVACRARRFEPRILQQDFGQAASFGVLHGNEETAVHFSEFQDLQNARVFGVKLLLYRRAAPLGFDNDLRELILALLDNLQVASEPVKRVALEPYPVNPFRWHAILETQDFYQSSWG